MKHYLFLLIVSVSLVFTSCQDTNCKLSSPDKHIMLKVAVANHQVKYSVVKNNKEIILPSLLGFDDKHYSLVSHSRSHKDETWTQTWGEELTARNNYNELTLTLKDEDGKLMNIRFRAFNDGVAFRYEFLGENEAFEIYKENTEYRFVDNPNTWSIPWDTPYYEALWQQGALWSKTDTMCSPITLEFTDGTYGFLHEANLTDWAAQNFYVDGEQILKTFLTPWSDGVSVYAQRGTTRSPWRMLILADDINELATSRLMLNLNEPCAIEDTSWIKPMKFIGIWWAIHLDHYSWCYRLLNPDGTVKGLAPHHGATTENMKNYIDFAAEHGFGGVLAEGWNEGWDGDWTSNLADFCQPYPDFDMDYLSQYAQQKGVQIIGHHETGGNVTHYEQQMEKAFRYYDEHGIHNVKTGYVHRKLEGKEYHKSQYGVRHMRKVIELAARNHICIDNHECVMPTGLQRTYPNLMTGEGVRGQEWDAWSTDGGSPAEHLCVLPFTRVLAGPVDFTPGTFDFSNPIHPQTRVHSTLARQLALFVVIYSPLQMASDMPESYMKHPDAFRFIEQVPCDWQKTQIVDAKIGDYVITARQDRNSDTWYIGAITDEQERDILIPLSMLDNNKQYSVQLYQDGAQADWQTNPYEVSITNSILSSADTVSVHLAAAGGCALRLVPIK